MEKETTGLPVRGFRAIVYYGTIYIFAAVILFVAVFPFYWMVLTSLKNPQDITKDPPIIFTTDLTLRNYIVAFTGSHIGRYLINSLIVASLTTIVGISVATFASYAFSRFKFPGKSASLLTILSVQMFPSLVILIPMYIVMGRLGLTNSYMGLVITYTTFTLPFCVWMLKGFFDSIPKELEESGKIDGCSMLGSFFRLTFPLSLPGIFATSIFAFIAAWNEFVFALTFISNEKMKTMPLGLTSFMGKDTTDWGAIMAASVIFCIPVLIFFLAVQKHMTQGLVSGSVKG